MKSRKYTLKRETTETNITVSVNLDGIGKVSINTGIKFLDHVVSTFGKHSLSDIILQSNSKDNIKHHLVEDVAITVGTSINHALGNRSGIQRFGFASIPMDESLVESSIDLITRSYNKIHLKLQRDMIEDMHKEDIEHFFESLVKNLCCCIHISTKYGANDHHIIEAAIKSLAVAFRLSSTIDKKQGSISSTKNVM